MGTLGGNANKDKLIEREGCMINEKGALCITGVHKLGNLGSNALKDKYIKRDGHVIDDKGALCITGFHNIGKKGAKAYAKNCKAAAMDENHWHMCTSALCQSGTSIEWQGSHARMRHTCCDSEKSGLYGQKATQVALLGLHMCKKCHRTAKECKAASCVAPTCSNKSLTLSRHLH